MIPPKLAMKLVKNQIEKQLKKEVEKFAINFKEIGNKFYFEIDGENYNYESELIISVFKAQLAALIPDSTGHKIDGFRIEYEKNSMTARVYYTTKENQKLYDNLVI